MLVAVLTVSPVAAAEWTGGVSGFLFDPPADDAFGLGIVSADRAALHLEGRYNYEALDTGSLFGGWTLTGGEDVAWSLTPMLGLLVGKTDGIAPGVEAELGWRALLLYVESEYVFDFASRDDNFFYSWIEATGNPTEWLRIGMVAQRTKSYSTSLEMQRGPMMEVSYDQWALGTYWLNPDRADGDELFAFSMSYEW